jgi:hypothetical protein
MVYHMYELLRLRNGASDARLYLFRDFAEYVTSLYAGTVRLSDGALQLIQQNRLLAEQNDLERERNRLERERLDVDRQRLLQAEELRRAEETSRLEADAAASEARRAAESATRRDEILREVEHIIFCDKVYRNVSRLNRRRFMDVVDAYVANKSGGVRGGVRMLGRFGNDEQGRLISELMLDPLRKCPPFDPDALYPRLARLTRDDQETVHRRVVVWEKTALRPVPETVTEALQEYMPEVYVALSRFFGPFQEMCDLRRVTLEDTLLNDTVYLPFVVAAVARMQSQRLPITGTKHQIAEMHNEEADDDRNLRQALYDVGWRSTTKRRLR